MHEVDNAAGQRAPSDGRQPETLPAQGETQHGVPRAPHERDESAHSDQTAGEPSMQRVGTLAQQDVERGLTDTSKGAELDTTYDKLREGLPDGEKKFSP